VNPSEEVTATGHVTGLTVHAPFGLGRYPPFFVGVLYQLPIETKAIGRELMASGAETGILEYIAGSPTAVGKGSHGLRGKGFATARGTVPAPGANMAGSTEHPPFV